MRSSRLRQASGAAILALGVAATTVLPAAAAEPALLGIPGWGWVVARQPSTASYAPGPKDQGNSSGGTNTVEHLGTGSYRIAFGGVGTSNVVIHVSPLGTAPRTCIVDEWGTDSLDFVALVDCRTRTGASADARFVVNMLSLADAQDDAGFVVANEPTTTDYIPDIRYNSADATNSIHRLGTGRWQVTMPDLGGASGRGSAQVTAGGIPGSVCRVVKWAVGVVVTVVCRDRAGATVDAPFHLTFMKGRGLKFEGDPRTAYVLADQPMTSRYAPRSGYWFSTSRIRPAIRRTGVGAYVVTLPGQQLGGSAQVSANGGGSRRCVVAGIEKKVKPQRIRVLCFTADGRARADARFLLHYAK